MLLGNLKKLEEMTIHDYFHHPIWVNDLSGESKRGFDETSERPYLGNDSVSRALFSQFFQVSVLVKIDSQFDGVAYFMGKDEIFTLSVWHEGKWKDPTEVIIKEEVEVVCVPMMFGCCNETYIFNLKNSSSYNKRYPPLW